MLAQFRERSQDSQTWVRRGITELSQQAGHPADHDEVSGGRVPAAELRQQLGRYEEAADLGFENRSGPIGRAEVDAFDQLTVLRERRNAFAVKQ